MWRQAPVLSNDSSVSESKRVLEVINAQALQIVYCALLARILLQVY